MQLLSGTTASQPQQPATPVPAFAGVTGLPRAGSTLLCQLLAQHPDIQCDGASSPLFNTLLGVRDLAQIYGSIEAQHQRTLLIDFIDHLADFDRMGRADMLFAQDEAIGAPLSSLMAVPDLPKSVQEHLYVLRFEDLVARPTACMSHICAWLGLAPFEITPDRLTVRAHESDSHYHMKYTHRQSSSITVPARHEIPPRIQARIEATHPWFYETYYPGNEPGVGLGTPRPVA